MVHTRSSSRRIPDPLVAGLFRSRFTPALDRHDTAAVRALRLHGEPGGPTSITGTARSVLAIFYIVMALPGVWLMFAPLVFWAPDVAADLNGVLVGRTRHRPHHPHSRNDQDEGPS